MDGFYCFTDMFSATEKRPGDPDEYLDLFGWTEKFLHRLDSENYTYILDSSCGIMSKEKEVSPC